MLPAIYPGVQLQLLGEDNADEAEQRLQQQILTNYRNQGMNAEADACLNAFLRANPNDIDAWMQLAIVKDALGLVQDSQNAIIQAYRINANEAARRLQSSEQLQRIAAPLFRRRQP